MILNIFWLIFGQITFKISAQIIDHLNDLQYDLVRTETTESPVTYNFDSEIEYQPVDDVTLFRGNKESYNIKSVKFIQQTHDSIAIRWKYEKWMKDFVILIKPDSGGIEQKMFENKPGLVQFNGLKPATNYYVRLQARKPRGGLSPWVMVKVFTAPAMPKNVKLVAWNRDRVVVSWDNPNTNTLVRQVATAICSLSKAPDVYNLDIEIDQDLNTATISTFPAGTSWDLMIFYMFNGRRSDSAVIRVTKPPFPVKSLESVKVSVQDAGLADLKIKWEWPDEGYWGTVNLQISPPLPEPYPSVIKITNLQIPHRVRRNHQTLPDKTYVIPGLQQGQKYTITCFLSRGPLESEYVTIVQDIPKLIGPNQLEDPPERLLCRPPLNLSPENLKLIKNVVGQDPSLTIEWTHPKQKLPEDGYYVIVASFSDNSASRIFEISKEFTSFIFDGPLYDPFDDHTVTVVARHVESKTSKTPLGSDFSVRKHTADLIKDESHSPYRDLDETAKHAMFEQIFLVSPNACCGYKLYNSDDKKCCGGTKVFTESETLACCGTKIYDIRKEICCGGKELLASKTASLSEENPCGLATYLEGSSQLDTNFLTKNQVIHRENDRANKKKNKKNKKRKRNQG